MIEAVIVMKELSEPLLIRSFSKTFEPIKTALISQILEAIRGLAEEELKDVLQEIKLEERTIYLWKVGQFVISIVTDGQETREILDDLVKNINEIISHYDPEEIMLNIEIQKKVSREIASHVLMERMGINVLKEITDELKSLMELANWGGKELKIKNLKPKIFRPRKSLIKLIRSTRKARLDYLLEPFIKGKLEEVVDRASYLLGHEEIGDWAKAFYVKAGVLLNTRPIKFRAPKIEDLLAIAEQINDETLRKIMIEWVKSLFEVSAMYRLRMIYIENRKKLFEMMRESPEIEKAILIILLGIPDMRLIVRTISVFKDVSSFIVANAYTKQQLLFISGYPIKTVADWLKMHSQVRKIYEKYSNMGGGEYLALPYLLSYIWVLNAKNVKQSDLELIVKSLLDFWESKGKKLVDSPNILSSCHRSAIRIFSYYFPRFISYMLTGDKKLIENLIGDMENALSSAASHYEARRILNLMTYNIVATAVIDLFTRILYELKIQVKNIIDLIESIIDPEMTKTMFVNRFHMVYYIMAIHSAITHTLLLLPESSMRQALAERLLDLAVVISDHIKRIMPLAMFFAITYKRLLEIVPKELQEKYREGYDTLINLLPEAIKDILGE